MDKQQKRTAGLFVEPARRKTLVCVTDQFSCERIIQAGRVIANITHTELAVLNIASPGHLQNPEALQFLFDVSRENEADMTVLYSENFAKTMTQFIKNNRVVHLLTGMPGSEDSILYRIWNKFSHLNCFTVSPEGDVRRVDPSEKIA